MHYLCIGNEAPEKIISDIMPAKNETISPSFNDGTYWTSPL